MTELFDRVKENCTVAGTGDITCTGAVDTSFEAYGDRYSDGDIVPYCVVESATSYEIGEGVYTVSNTSIARTAAKVLASSNADGLVAFGAWAKVAFVSLSAQTVENDRAIGANDIANEALRTIATIHSNTLDPQRSADTYTEGFSDGDHIVGTNHVVFNGFMASQSVAGQYSQFSLVYIGVEDITSEDTTPVGIACHPEGKRLYVLGSSTDILIQYDLSTPFDMSGLTLDGTVPITALSSSASGIDISSDGISLYIAAGGEIQQYRTRKAWDFGALISLTEIASLNIGAQTTNASGVVVSKCGLVMSVMDENGEIFTYRLDIPFLVSSGVYVSTKIGATGVSGLSYGYRSAKEEAFYFVDTLADDVFRSPVDIANAALDISNTTGSSVGARETAPRDIAIGNGGADLFLVGTATDEINHFKTTISAAIDVTSSSTITAETQPDAVQVTVLQNSVAPITINTDLILSVSRNGGAAYTTAVLSLVGSDLNGRDIYSARVDVSGQSAGTSMKFKVVTTSTRQEIHGVSMKWW